MILVERHKQPKEKIERNIAPQKTPINAIMQGEGLVH